MASRARYIPPPPPLDAPSPRQLVRENLHPVEKAVRQFEQLVREWTAPSMRRNPEFDWAVKGVIAKIRAITPQTTPKDVVGHGVFQVGLDDRSDMKFELASVVFTDEHDALDVFDAFKARQPHGFFALCEIREKPVAITPRRRCGARS